MLVKDPASWLSLLGVLVPVAFAARKKPRPGGKKQPPSPRKKHFPWLEVIIIGGALAAILGSLGYRVAVHFLSSPSRVSAGGPSPVPSVLENAVREQMQAQVTRNCPRMAAITWGDGGRPRQLVVDLISVECMSLMCEQPEEAGAGSASTRSQPHPLCESAFSGLKDQMLAVTNKYRLACPEIAVPWAERPWSPSTELGFYAALRPCMERICERLVLGEGIPEKYCVLAADIAEGFGDMPAAARLRQRAQALQAFNEVQWQRLTPEELEEAKTNQDMKLFAKRWGEVCAQGMQKYCEFLADYCRAEGYPPDVCPPETRALSARDAGSR